MTHSNAERFWSKVDKTDSCWLWTAGISTKGYGIFHVRLGAGSYRQWLAHRLAYEWSKGPIPAGLQIDHLCRVRNCVNPDHLEAVTQRENLARGIGPELTRRRWRSQTHCKRGHPLSGDNIRITSQGSRQCLTCVRERRAASVG